MVSKWQTKETMKSHLVPNWKKKMKIEDQQDRVENHMPVAYVNNK